jgi:hypothetical protein
MSRYADLWAEAPDWVQYIAMDHEGCVYGWENKPEQGRWYYASFDGRVYLFDGIFGPTPDWRDSLERRPRPTNPTLCPHCGKEI